MKRIFATIAATAFAIGAAPALADKGHAKHQAGATEMIDGEVRKVDMDTKKLTIKHGPMPSLDMPAMTMVFGVTDAALLDKVKTGDKIKFRVVREDGKMLVTDIQAAK